MIQELAKCKKDPIYFITNYIKVQHPTKGNIPFNLFEYQERFVRCMHENRFVVTLQPRQCGKCIYKDVIINTAVKPKGFRKFVLKIIDRKTFNDLFSPM